MTEKTGLGAFIYKKIIKPLVAATPPEAHTVSEALNSTNEFVANLDKVLSQSRSAQRERTKQ